MWCSGWSRCSKPHFWVHFTPLIFWMTTYFQSSTPQFISVWLELTHKWIHTDPDHVVVAVTLHTFSHFFTQIKHLTNIPHTHIRIYKYTSATKIQRFSSQTAGGMKPRWKLANSGSTKKTVPKTGVKIKVAQTWLLSIGFQSWSRFFGSQPAGDVSHKPGGRLPLLSARPTVTIATLKKAATNFAAWWTEAQWVWTVCLWLLPNSVAAAIWTQALLRLSPAR